MHYATKHFHGRLRRAGALVLAVVMVFCAMTVVVPQAQAAVTKDQINNLKNQASTLSAQKAEIQAELNKLASSKDAALDEKILLEEKINVLRQEITVSEEAIQKYGEMIALKEEELAEAQEKEAQYYDKFCERVRSMEERGDISYWSVLFNASSFSDLLDRVSAIAEVVDYDNQIMDELAAARQAVADAKADLEENKAAEEETKANLTAQKADLEADQAQVEQLIAQINSQADIYEQKMHEVEEDSASVAKQISQAEATYAAQLEAQRKAEEAKKKAEAEAAAKKAAEEAAKKNQGSSSSSSSGGSSSSSGSSGSVGSGGYMWPLSGYTRVSSPFGYRNCPFHGRELHGGCDVPAPAGTPVMAAKSGVVIISTYGSSYGNYVTIAHSDGSRTLYAHMSSRAVSPGTSVSQGQVIGYVGSTGSSTGNHLHFELWLNSSSSSRVNPVAYCF